MVSHDDRNRILLVDDERLNLNILNNLLKDEYHISVAMNGQQALERAAAHQPPDLILLDIVMPGMDGFEVCKRLKANPETEDIPVIFITAKSSELDEVAGLKQGAVDYISKPIQPAIVQARITNHLVILRQRRELQEMHRQLLAFSRTDSLTGLANRGRFDEFLIQEWSRSQRSQTSLGLLMMDIDFFKRYNDHYGHPGGDSCLKQVAKALKGIIQRPTDLVARYGGEEFVCVLSDTDLEGVREVGQAILQAIRNLAIPHEKSEVEDFVTLSIGGTSVVLARRGNSPEDLLQQADELLYQSKTAGRNRLTVQKVNLMAGIP